jgi:hypothetical protein
MEASFQLHATAALPIAYWVGGWVMKKLRSLTPDNNWARTIKPLDSRYTNYSNLVPREEIGLLRNDSYTKSTFLTNIW